MFACEQQFLGTFGIQMVVTIVCLNEAREKFRRMPDTVLFLSKLLITRFLWAFTYRYLDWSQALQDAKLAASEQKSLIAVLFDKTGWPADNELGSLLSQHAVCLDMNTGTGTALSHQYDETQLTDLVNQCNGTLYGTGDIHPPEPPPTPDHGSRGSQGSQILDASNLDSTTDYTLPPESKQPFPEEASAEKPISQNHEDIKVQEEIKRMAACAVAAAVAGATAQHVAKTNQSPAAIKAAATAAEVAQAVVDGNSDAASRGVAKVARIVEESAGSGGNAVVQNGVGTGPPKSSTCIIL